MRSYCSRCLRPNVVCYCPWLQSVRTRTKFIILMHEDERRRPVATGRMTALSLTNGELWVGNEVDDRPEFQDTLESGKAMLLYPGGTPVSALSASSDAPSAVFVIDAKWGLSSQLLRDNP